MFSYDPSMNLKLLKKKLREKIHVSLRAQEGAANPDAPLLVRDLFLGHFKNLPPGQIISGTMPIKQELDMQPLMQALAAAGHQLCLPVIIEKGAPLLFRAYKPGDPLDVSMWGIREPKQSHPPCVPSVLLCPMLAFDRAGRRLGYGGGYYDATLRDLRASRKVVAVGLAYAGQEVEEVPAGALDQRLDLIITEKEVIQPESGQ